MMSHSPLSVVDVDVLALRYDKEQCELRLGLFRRDTEPFEGQLALPGVVLTSGERLTEGALRALRRLAESISTCHLGQIQTFDEPMRDPRGPALSIAMWAAFDSTTHFEHECTLDTVPSLAFDHNRIITVSRLILGDLLWRNDDFTRTLIGPRFSSTDAVQLTQSLIGQPIHRANLNRTLDGIKALTRAESASPHKQGRPATTWIWNDQREQR